MGVEAVHRALARQSLGQLGNDRVFMKYDQPETAPGAPNKGQPGFVKIADAAAQLQAAGFGFGAKGATPGAFYDFDAVSATTPNDPDLNTLRPVRGVALPACGAAGLRPGGAHGVPGCRYSWPLSVAVRGTRCEPGAVAPL